MIQYIANEWGQLNEINAYKTFHGFLLHFSYKDVNE